MFSALNPSFASPVIFTSNLNSVRRVSCVLYLSVPSFMDEHMGLSRFGPVRLRVFCTKAWADYIGQRTGSPVAYCVFLSFSLPFFWYSKFSDTAWAWKVPGSPNSIL